MRPAGRGRQTIMFSATFPREMQDMALDFLDTSYLQITVGRVGATTSNVEQRFEDVGWGDKFEALVKSINSVKTEEGRLAKTIIFANQKSVVDDIAWRLGNERVRAVCMHGNLSQSQRERALGELKGGRASVLVATDVAARGLDLPGVDHVINYDLPSNSDDYVHRIGRTGRIGNKGVATSFVTGWEPALKNIVKQIQSTNAQKQEEGEAVAPIPRWVVEQAERSTGSTNRYG